MVGMSEARGVFQEERLAIVVPAAQGGRLYIIIIILDL